MMWLEIACVVGAIFLAGAYSGFETGNYLLNRVRLRFRREEGDARAQVLADVLRDQQGFIFTVLIGHNLCVYIASIMVTGIYADMGVPTEGVEMVWRVVPWCAEVAATLTLMLPIFLLAEVGPKNWFLRRANTYMYAVGRALQLSRLAFAPLAWPLRLLARLLPGAQEAGGGGEELLAISRRRLQVFFSQGASEGVLTQHQTEMMDRVMTMRQTPVAVAMTPLADAASVAEEATVADLLEVARERQAERVILYRGSSQEVSGFVHIYDLMDPAVQPGDALAGFRRDSFAVGLDSSLHQAFFRLSRARQSWAVVVDDVGKSVGQVELEDLAGHIVHDD